MTYEELGMKVAEALRLDDRDALERLCLIAGTYTLLVAAAVRAGVDQGELEDALARI